MSCPEDDGQQEEFKDHLCIRCGDPCNCDFKRGKCCLCSECQVDFVDEEVCT
jgi:hypothetical protein